MLCIEESIVFEHCTVYICTMILGMLLLLHISNQTKLDITKNCNIYGKLCNKQNGYHPHTA